MSWTLVRYLSTQFLFGLIVSFTGFMSVAFLFDLVELMRRVSAEDPVPFSAVLGMALLKLPSLGEKVLPFVVLFGSVWTFLKLTRRRELVVARAAGVSAWQFLSPALLLAFGLGILAIAVYNPVASTMVTRFEELESQHLQGQTSLISVSSTGFWLRQAHGSERAVIHALKVSHRGTRLEDVIIFAFDAADHFTYRIDATSAALRTGHWEIRDAWMSGPDMPSTQHTVYRLGTALTPLQIQESFASPETLSFWELPGFIRTAESAGFSALRHRLHWHSLVTTPLLFCAMVLVAATFSLGEARLRRTGIFLAGVVAAGFAFYALMYLSQALALSRTIPLMLGAWAPAGITLLLGATVLFHLEDG